nr:unnamed protein product [Spirometra erinaceieuropaei]
MDLLVTGCNHFGRTSNTVKKVVMHQQSPSGLVERLRTQCANDPTTPASFTTLTPAANATPSATPVTASPLRHRNPPCPTHASIAAANITITTTLRTPQPTGRRLRSHHLLLSKLMLSPPAMWTRLITVPLATTSKHEFLKQLLRPVECDGCERLLILSQAAFEHSLDITGRLK